MPATETSNLVLQWKKGKLQRKRGNMKRSKNLWSIVSSATCVACFFQVAPIRLVEGGHKTEVTLVMINFKLL